MLFVNNNLKYKIQNMALNGLFRKKTVQDILKQVEIT
jgi:hypothetical protein